MEPDPLRPADMAAMPAERAPTRHALAVRASIAGAVAAAVVCAAIWLGSRGLHDFDAALVGYAIATVFLAFGVAYRYTVWVSSPPAKRLFLRGWGAFFSWRNFRRFPTAVPQAAATYLGFQTFLGARSRQRWIAHQLIFWGCVLAVLITFPLTWGWFTFTSPTGAGPQYTMRLWGQPLFTFNALSLFGWLNFHALDIAAVLVIAGCSYFLRRRMRDREATVGQRFAYDFVPLVALVVVSVTGLLLTFSAWLLHGGGYQFLAIIHMAAVVFTLVYLPFGKFFHIIQRPAAVGMQTFKQTTTASSGLRHCRVCGTPIDTDAYVDNLRATMRDLGLDFDEWAETCPRCKRVERGRAYLGNVKRGFK